MADNSFRSYRSRDPQPHGSDGGAVGGRTDDPLAELARMIGQSEPMPAPAASLDEHAAASDWGADDRYAEQEELAPEYSDDGYEEHSGSPRLPDPYAPYRPAPSPGDVGYAAPGGNQFPGQPLRLNGARDDGGYAVAQPRYGDEQERQPAFGRPLPAFLPRSRDDRYEYDDEEQAGADDRSYAADDDEDDAPSGRRRGGFVLVAAVLGLAVLGTAGAFAYRAMFGGSMLPSLPPIIRADNGPNKILPNAGPSQGNNANQLNASGNIGEKLVSREEKPVDVPAPVSTAPRVVSTIPIFPAPDSPPPGALASVTSGAAASAVPPAMSPSTATPPPRTVGMPMAPAALSTEPKKIHTLAIRPDQSGGIDATAAVTPTPPSAARPTPPRPMPMAAAMPKPALAPAPPSGGNAPLSIVPSQGDIPAAAPVRSRTALAQPTPISPAAMSGGTASAGSGYAVQISSQRSEAEAQTAFRALLAKFPAQLGGREPMVRRADLGSKGVYYRALVGPFASMEQAANMCSSLKAAGGNCIVQRN